VTKYLLPPTYTLSAAEAAGLTRAQLRDDGVRITRGAYASRGVHLTLDVGVRAALEVLPEDSLASHRTAAALLGAPVRTGWPLTFTVPPGIQRPRRAGLRFHVRTLELDDRTLADALPVTAGPQTFLDLATEVQPEELVALGDALYRRGHLDSASLAARLARAHGTRGVVRARTCAPLLTPLAASRPESLLRYWLIDSDLPDPQPQVPIHDAWGREVAHADLGYERWKIALEYEGRQHADREQFGRDLVRYSLMASDGWLVLRFGERDLGARQRAVSRVAGALHSRGVRW
jgi:hypothetical protein